MSTTTTLPELREQIDLIDERIVGLLNQRARVASEVGIIKGNTPKYRPEREAEVIRHITGISNGPLPDSSLVMIYGEIMKACLNLE